MSAVTFMDFQICGFSFGYAHITCASRILITKAVSPLRFLFLGDTTSTATARLRDYTAHVLGVEIRDQFKQSHTGNAVERQTLSLSH
jgi:hypothetical protein